MAKTYLTAERVRSVFTYDKDTGDFLRNVTGHGVPIYPKKVGVTMDNGYRYIHIDMRAVRAHRLAWLYVTGEWPSNCIDHINGDKSDNRFSNLRHVTSKTNAENRRNPKATASSGYIGVSRDRNKWRATIVSNGKQKHIGSFSTAEEAAEAYIAEKRRTHYGCTI